MRSFWILFAFLLMGENVFGKWAQIKSTEGKRVTTLATMDTSLVVGMAGEGLFYSDKSGVNFVKKSDYFSTLSESQSLFYLKSNLYLGLYYEGVFRSGDFGTSWSRLTNGFGFTSWVHIFAANENYLFAGAEGSIMRSVDNGDSFQEVKRGTSFLGLAVKNSNVFAGDERLYHSRDNGESWNRIGEAMDFNAILSLLILDSNIFVGTFKRGLFHSEDFGDSWANIGKGFPDSAITIALASYKTSIFAGTSDSGIYCSSDSGRSWRSINEGLISQGVGQLVVKDSILYAGTYGEGLWRRPLSEIAAVSTPSVQLKNPFALKIMRRPGFGHTLEFRLDKKDHVFLSLFDAQGKEIINLVNASLLPGLHAIKLNNKEIGQGLFFLRFISEGINEVQKIFLE